MRQSLFPPFLSGHNVFCSLVYYTAILTAAGQPLPQLTVYCQGNLAVQPCRQMLDVQDVTIPLL